MGAVETTYTFTATDTITSTKMNNIIDQTVMTSDAIIGTTLELSSSKLRVRSAGITSNELATNSVTTTAITDANVTAAKLATDSVITAKIAADSVTAAKLAPDSVTTVKILDANVTPAKLSQKITSETAQTASSTAVTFTGIPSWAKRVTLVLSGVSTGGSSVVLVQLGTSSGFVTTGYVTGTQYGGAASIASTTGFNTYYSVASSIRHGHIVLTNLTGNTWVGSGIVAESSTGSAVYLGGTIALAGVFDRIRVTTVNGTDTFDAGTINIIYE